MKIGTIDLGERPVFFAPMEDVSDPSFRRLCKEFGADMMYTEFISSDGLIRDAEKSVRKLDIADYERPVGIQIYGKNPEAMVEAALRCEEAQPDLIDLNFGCPVKRVAGKGAGAGLLQNIPLMLEITARVVKAVKIPVTVKTRLGWDENNLPIVSLAEQLQDVGIAALTVHGRTRKQMYKGEADWTLIGAIKENSRMTIPIIGNGDVSSPEIALQKFTNYSVDAIMIGRAAIGKPWLFKEVKHFLQNGELLPPITIPEKVELAKRHLSYSLERKGDITGVFEMRQHFSNYFKGLPNFKETRIRLVTETNPNTIHSILDEIAAQWGDY
ncbi:MAG: tRNA dihydrouridine synthase DusB [Bacteroidetes bacterium HGW-Bacteroidetes-4]|nr:MAG: tRNA dihydrouridine synthase DusB [Bacteroidetes bacterium HGW-Bacteroidetes-4]